MADAQRRVCVVVLGDVARSPRMCYHAASLAAAGHQVHVLGFLSSAEDTQSLAVVQKAVLHALPPLPALLARLPSALSYAVKSVWQAVTLLLWLLWMPRFGALLLQNPPGVPALPVCWLACRLRGARLVVDWHNYSHSILALALGSGSRLVRVARCIEFFFGRRADAGLCVTEAMREDLRLRWRVNDVSTLHDRPAARFTPSVSLLRAHALFQQLSSEHAQLWRGEGPDSTAFTQLLTDGRAQLRDDRPGLLVSATSWTEDEDFSLLLHALDEYEKARLDQPTALPRLVCVITGRGPLRRFYEQLVGERRWRHVQLVTAWLSEQDYPLLLACADLGVSLHTSSSGLDLPMKVVDMFGAGLPVCAVQFRCLHELVRHGENGFVFRSGAQLAEQLADWFRGFPLDGQLAAVRSRFRSNIDKFRAHGWDQNWNRVARPMF